MRLIGNDLKVTVCRTATMEAHVVGITFVVFFVLVIEAGQTEALFSLGSRLLRPLVSLVGSRAFGIGMIVKLSHPRMSLRLLVSLLYHSFRPPQPRRLLT